MAHSLAGTRVAVSGSITFALFLGSASAIFAQTPTTRFVATNSTANGPGCGTRERPCRTISQAIRNAVDGDLIEVGPGIYGDLDQDGSAGVGNEDGPVLINKAVTVYSAAGPAVTIIRGAQNPSTGVLSVDIRADGATFGRRNGGFTIVGRPLPTGGAPSGVSVSANDVTVIGNVVTGNNVGFIVGFGERVRFERNVAVSNFQTGFLLPLPDAVVINNVAIDNGIGFLLFGERTTFTGNVAVANKEVGIETLVDVEREITGNSILGNGIAGIRFQYTPPGILQRVEIHGNNIFGNGEAADGCGVLQVVSGSINATDNYWGKATGPGPNPGDRAYGSCLTAGSMLTSPFSAVQFPIEDPTVQ